MSAPPPLAVAAALRERLKALYLRDYAGANRLDPDKMVDDVFSPVRFHEQRQSLEGLAAAQGFLRHEMAVRLRLRYTPALLFELDRSLESEQRVEELLRQMRQK